ncbi:MAG: class D beta-lactamase [Balneolaceae bacterium]|nr:class D beta-lactamase [Balneolaceae bacterium]
MLKRLPIIFFLTLYATITFGQINYQTFFDNLGLDGSTTIYDYNNQEWIYTDRQDAKRATLPASTFKIPNSLFAIEYKVVQNEYEIFEWDGEPKKHLGNVVNAWNQDTDLKSAYKHSTIWFYEEVAKQIKRDHYKKTLNKIGYGNGNYDEKGVDFWNYGEFAVTPKNQIEFLIRLHENRLPFSTETVEKVKDLMITETSDSFIYRDKTGWTRKDGTDIGWWVGYVETQDNVYFFATKILKDEKDHNPHFSNGRKEITKNILNEIIESQIK